MSKVVALDLTGKQVELQPEPDQILFFFAAEDTKHLTDLLSELPNHEVTLSAMLLGSDTTNLAKLQAANPKLSLYRISSISQYKHLDVEDLPWIVHMQNTTMKKSVNLNDLAPPFLTNLLKTQARRPTKKETAKKATENSGKNSRNDAKKKPSPEERLKVVERRADANRQEIEHLRSEIAKRDEQINDLLEQLEAVKAVARPRTPRKKTEISYDQKDIWDMSKIPQDGLGLTPPKASFYQ